MEHMVKIIIAAALFVAPVVYIVRRELAIKREQAAKGGSRGGGAVNLPSFIKVSAALLLFITPIFLLSFSSYSFYSPKDAAVKVAFKHTGKRIMDCDENELIKREGEKYRKQLKDTRQVKMNISKLGDCSRERHSVVVELLIDGKEVLNKAYSPTGIKKDMASYIYEEFLIEPGAHNFTVRLYDKGNKAAPDFVYEDSFIVKAQEIKLIRFDDKAGRLVME